MSSPYRRGFRSAGGGAFTLVEILTVVAIIGVLIGLLFPVMNSVKQSARKSQAMGEAKAVVNAIKAYYAEYGKYPMTDLKLGFDTIYGNPGQSQLYGSEDVMNILLAVDDGVNAGHRYNPRRIVFYEGKPVSDPDRPKGGLGEDNKLYDPWGNEYLIMMDGNYDGEFGDGWFQSNFQYEDDVGDHGSVAVWSYGPDGEMGDEGNRRRAGSDDVTSW